MRKNIEKESLNEILDYLKMPMLPQPNIESKIWTKAVVKIQCVDGTVGYIYATHDLYAIDELKIEKVFSGAGIYHSTLAIYPFEYLDASVLPILENKADIIDFVLPRCKEEKEHLESMKLPALRTLFYNICIKEQLYYSNTGIRKYSDHIVVDNAEPEAEEDQVPQEKEFPKSKEEKLSLTIIGEGVENEEF